MTHNNPYERPFFRFGRTNVRSSVVVLAGCGSSPGVSVERTCVRRHDDPVPIGTRFDRNGTGVRAFRSAGLSAGVGPLHHCRTH
ncbi:hypothetical protein BRC80_10945 [Halobacteriales archaeon QH_9_66_26]|nr:MAG: hypothetical protein BRC80_10945 [Halobacteriales archaeon QH_9_66_26]